MKTNGTTLDEKSVLLKVEFHRLGNTRRVSTSEIEVDADKSMLRVNKALLDSPEYDAIQTHDNKTRAWLASRALPSMFKEGVWRVPNSMVVDIDDYLQKRATERKGLVKAFYESYNSRRDESLGRLNGLADPNDYLSAEEAASRFSLTWQYITFGTPDSLKNLKAGLFEREKQKIEKLMVDATQEMQQVLRLQMTALVKRMVTQLTPSADGKKKKIYDSLVGNISDFLDTFDARNIADDAELKKVVSKARDLLSGVDPKILREAEDTRTVVKVGFETIQKELDTMIVDKPRQFDFSD